MQTLSKIAPEWLRFVKPQGVNQTYVKVHRQLHLPSPKLREMIASYVNENMIGTSRSVSPAQQQIHGAAGNTQTINLSNKAEEYSRQRSTSNDRVIPVSPNAQQSAFQPFKPMGRPQQASNGSSSGTYLTGESCHSQQQNSSDNQQQPN